jgi:hypothetical protein
VEVEFSTENAGEFGNYVIGEARVLNEIPWSLHAVHCLLWNNDDSVEPREDFLNPPAKHGLD